MPSNGFLYIDSTPVDDGAPYTTGWDGVDFGESSPRSPVVQPTSGGSYTILPLYTNRLPRTGKITIYALATDILDKFRVESEMRALMDGPRKVHRAGRWLDVVFTSCVEAPDDSRKAATVVGMEGRFIVPQPLWSLNQPIKGLAPSAGLVNIGPEWDMWDDNSIPSTFPPYQFTTNSFSITNWGNAFTWAAGTITGGPTSTTVYLKGSGAQRIAIPLDGSGAGSFTATQSFYLAPGANAIRLEDAGGSLVTVGGSFSISFGDTYPRFL